MPSIQSFLKTVKGKSILILGHAAADLDSVAAASSLLLSLPKKFKPTLGIPEHISEDGERLVEAYGIPFVLNPNFEQYDGIICVDFSAYDRVGKMETALKAYQKPIAIIDHHEATKNKVKSDFFFGNPELLASTEIVHEIIQKSKLTFTPIIAELIVIGIIFDTNHFQVGNQKVFSVLNDCLKKSKKSYSELRELTLPVIGFDVKIAQLKAAQRVKIFGSQKHIIVSTQVDAFEADAGDALIKQGADVAFIASTSSQGIRIIGRASNALVNEHSFDLVKDVFSKLQEKFSGTFGGHAGAAGFQIRAENPEPVLQAAVNIAIDSIEEKSPAHTFKQYK